VRHLTTEAILCIHDAISEQPTGQFDLEALRATVEEVLRVDEFGANVYPEIFTRAAAYLVCIVTYKPFTPENNARVAWAVVVVYLHYNGVAISETPFDHNQIADMIERGVWSEKDIVELLYAHSEFHGENPPHRRGLWEYD